MSINKFKKLIIKNKNHENKQIFKYQFICPHFINEF